MLRMGKGLGSIQLFQGLLIIGDVTLFVVSWVTLGQPIHETMVAIHSDPKVNVTPDKLFNCNPAAFQPLLSDVTSWVPDKVNSVTRIDQVGNNLPVISQADQQTLLSPEVFPLFERVK
jgi:hypothetical protein